MWTLEEALVLVRQLEPWLARDGFHCALAGSILTRGASAHDLDLIVFPHDASEKSPGEAHQALTAFGLVRTHDAAFIRSAWRKKGSNDVKHVEVYQWAGKRIDVISVQ